MKKVFPILVLLAFILPMAGAQVTYDTVTATVTDPAGHPYASAQYVIRLTDQFGRPVFATRTLDGQPFNSKTVTGSLDATGNMSVQLVPNNILVDSATGKQDTQWQFTIARPADSAILTVNEATSWSINYSTTITASVDLSSQLSSLAGSVNFVNLRTGQSTIGGNGTVGSGISNQIAIYSAPGTAVGGASAIPNGITASTQSPGDNSTKVATTAYVDTGLSGKGTINPAAQFSVFGQQGAGTQAVASAIPNITADTSGNFLPNSSQTKLSPMADIRANGAKIDGVTDIGPALAASIAQCNVANGNSCTVLLPCAGPNGCFWANGTDGVTISSKTTLLLQGILNLQTTLTLPNNVPINLIGSDDKGIGAQFSVPAQYGQVSVPSDFGTLGTPVSVTLSQSGNFGVSQTFTPSTMAGLYVGTAITISDPLSCSITSASRVNGVTTLTLSSACHIPAGVLVTVSGNSDSGSNGAPSGDCTTSCNYSIQNSDYFLNKITYKSTSGSGTGTGGTITGLNGDTIEDVVITATTSTTATATFYRSHGASAQWALDGIFMAGNDFGQMLKNIQIAAPGVGILDNAYISMIDHVGIINVRACSTSTPFYTTAGISMPSASWVTIRDSAIDAPCEPYAIRTWAPWSNTFANSGPFFISGTRFTGGGVKEDFGGANVTLINDTCDRCAGAAIIVDPTNYFNSTANVNNQIYNLAWNDNPNSFWQSDVMLTVPAAVGNIGTVCFEIDGVSEGPSTPITNDYVDCVKSSSAIPTSYYNQTPRGVAGVMVSGRQIEGEIRGEQAGMSPSVIPHATANIKTDPSTWTGNCTVTTGVIGPDGTPNAGGLIQNSSFDETFGSLGSLTPVVGDYVLFGAWVYSPTGAKASGLATGGSVYVYNNSSTHFSFNYKALGGFSNAFGVDSLIPGDWWHPVVGLAQVTSSDGTSGQSVVLAGSCDTAKTLDYFDPWMMYVPASAGVPLAELQRWRAQLMHAYVPPNATAGTLAANPDLSAPWAAPLLNAADITADPNPAVCPANYNANSTSAFNVTLPSSPSTGCLVNLTNKNTATVTLQVQGGGSFTCISSGVPGSVTTCLVPEGDKGYANWNGTSWTVFVVPSGGGAGSVPAIPGWLLWQGDGSAGAFSCATGTCAIRGENWYSSVTISSGATAFQNDFNSAYFSGPLTIRSTGTCTIAGTLSASPNTSASGNNGNSFGAGSGGGGGGGTAAGAAGSNSGTAALAGAAGAASGGIGGNASAADHRDYNFLIAGSGLTTANFNLPYGGAKGGNGGSSGATGGFGGGGIVLDCATINFTGTIDVSGANGGAAAANNTGAGGGGGGGFVIMRSPNLTNSGTITLSGGAGGSCGAFTGCGAGGSAQPGWSKVFTQ